MELNFDQSHPGSSTEDLEQRISSILSHSPALSPHLSTPTAGNAKQGERVSSSESSRTKPPYLIFEGSGLDRDQFHCAGQLQALPPQQGIPGWQRITLMKYELDAHGFYDPGSCWAYEGIVLPGGQIILGRWWSPLNSDGEGALCGPFIFWNVRKPDEEGALLSPEDSGAEQNH